MAAYLSGLMALETTVLLSRLQVEDKKKAIKEKKEGERPLLGSCPGASQPASPVIKIYT